MAADPQILLMDEPFSALDPLIRRQLQKQFIDLAKVLKKTTLFITHDLDEAIRLGDHIAIMKDGLVQQFATPAEIYDRPANMYVAGFIGAPTLFLDLFLLQLRPQFLGAGYSGFLFGDFSDDLFGGNTEIGHR